MIVIDANVAVALFLPLPYSAAASAHWRQWKQAGRTLLAPTLWEYEVVTVLRKAIAFDMIDDALATTALARFLGLGITIVGPTAALHESALRWAAALGQSKTYDAHYLALAEDAGAEFWSADQRLVAAAAALGKTWVHVLTAD